MHGQTTLKLYFSETFLAGLQDQEINTKGRHLQITNLI